MPLTDYERARSVAAGDSSSARRRTNRRRANGDGRRRANGEERRRIAAMAVMVVAVAAANASAHRRDEYLQAARLGIEPNRVQIELDLTPGIAVAEAVVAEIDRDRTGAISADEAQAYAAVVCKAVGVEIDGTPIAVDLIDSQFPSVDAILKGEGAIRLQLAAAVPALAAGPHRLRYQNAHHPDIGVYLANALVPTSDRVSVTDQERDVDQRELTIAFVLHPDSGSGSATRMLHWLAIGITGITATLVAFFVLSRSRSEKRRR
jgi:hypothetical protein